MTRLAIIWYSRTGGSRQLAEAACDAAQEAGDIEVRLLKAQDADAEDLLSADGYIFACPENLAAIAGEGEALAERGALTAARENLATLTSICGATCTETVALSAVIDRGPMLATSAANDGVTQN